MMRIVIVSLAAAFLLGGCASHQPEQTKRYPRKPDNSSERKAGPAMNLYEQAEEDMDLSKDVIVIPPDQVKKKEKGSSATQ